MHRFDTIMVIADVGVPETPSLMINTWHFQSAVGPVEDYDNVRDMLQDFYQSLATDGFLSLTYVVDTAIRAYNLDDPQPRTPVYESGIELTGGTTAPMPSEVSIVMTFEAERVSGTVRGRRRNRKYLAPIAQAACGNDGRLKEATLVSLGAAASALRAAADASVTWDWRVWSDTDQLAFPVADGYVDNAFDTQRRRSFAPTDRLAWS